MWLPWEDYDFIYSRVPRLCVDIFIQRGDDLLLCYRDIEPEKDLWHLPGGRVQYGESLYDACNRIAVAEIGVPVSVRALIGFMEIPNEIQNERPRHSVSLVFACTVPTDPPESEILRFFNKCPSNINKPHSLFLKEVGLWNES